MAGRYLNLLFLLVLSLFLGIIARDFDFPSMTEADKKNSDQFGKKIKHLEADSQDEPINLKVKKSYKNKAEEVFAYDQQIEQIQEKLKKSDWFKQKEEQADDTQGFSYYPLGGDSNDALKKRKLYTTSENTFDGPGIIGFDRQDDLDQVRQAFKFVLTGLSKITSNFFFFYKNFIVTINMKTERFQKGGFMTLKPSDLPTNPSAYNYFESITAGDGVSPPPTLALYDISIAILRVEEEVVDEDIGTYMLDYTYEGAIYCNVLASYLGKYSACLDRAQYDSYSSNKGALVMLTPDDIKDGLLLKDDDTPAFEILIVPDYYLGRHEEIKTALGTGVDNIKDYTDKGGNIYATGKGGYLLEHWGMLEEGTYQTDYLLFKQFSSDDETLDIQIIKNNLQRTPIDFTLKSAQSEYSYLLNSFLMDEEKTVYSDNPFKIVHYISLEDYLRKKDINNNGMIEELGYDDYFFPFQLWKEYGNGKIIIVNGNPVYSSAYLDVFYTVMIYAMSRPTFFEAAIKTENDEPIPGGEPGILLNLDFTVRNLQEDAISNIEVHFWLVEDLVAYDLEENCQVVTEDPNNLISYINGNKVNQASHIKCTYSELAQMTKLDSSVKLEITSYKVTQSKYNILMALPVYVYTLDGETYTYAPAGVYTSASLAALLSVTFSQSSTRFYPLEGKGHYMGSTLKVQNKEDTSALEVDYVQIIPMISPVVDRTDQREMIKLVEILTKYYNDIGTGFPFSSEIQDDYLDFHNFVDRGVALVVEWDTAVSVEKLESRPEHMVNYEECDGGSGEVDVINCNYHTIVDSANIVLHQTYLTNSENFYEESSQRLLVFVDPNNECGRDILYADGYPTGVDATTAATRQQAFTRVDLYFYDGSSYNYPEGINEQTVISYDQYDPSYTLGESCIETFGSAEAEEIQEGYFDSSQTGGIKAREYCNELQMYCNKMLIDKAYIEQQGNMADSVFPTHYLVRVTDPDITTGSQIRGFVGDADQRGHHSVYTDLQFLYAHYYENYITSSYITKGGRIIISGASFVEDYHPIDDQLVTFSSDEIGFYKTEYVEGNIICYFKKGQLDVSAKKTKSYFGIFIERINPFLSDVTLQVSVEALKYDITDAENDYESYEEIEAPTDRVFTPVPCYSLPAVEVHFKMNREGESSIYGYENLGTYTTYGTYVQELFTHSTIYSLMESHHGSEPGLQSTNLGFSIISSLGLSTKALSDHISTSTNLIPATTSTTRISWKDVWGRQWIQPIRVDYADVVKTAQRYKTSGGGTHVEYVPTVRLTKRSLLVSSTFEMISKASGERILEWDAEEDVTIRVQLKFLSNYNKYFSLSRCKDTEVSFYGNSATDSNSYFGFDFPEEYEAPTGTTSNSYINMGHVSRFGLCYNERDETKPEGQQDPMMSGSILTEEERTNIVDAYLCAKGLTLEEYEWCVGNMSSLPRITPKPEDSELDLYNFSPEILDYYPENYISTAMWNLEYRDYDHSYMDVAYAYHMDITLPSLDLDPRRPATTEPDNLVTVYVYKGFGYSIEYGSGDRWWSDNLQNRDYTLLAGQDVSNEVSVDKATPLTSDKWVSASSLTGGAADTVIPERLKNIYTCLFNQHRVDVHDTDKYYYLPNVVQNNVIPIEPNIDPEKLTNYEGCSTQYTPENIYTATEIDNYYTTNTLRDQMYFGVNLRGGAKETLNMEFTMTALSSLHEEDTKIFDGVRFAYRNPASGLNSYTYFESPIHVVQASNSQLSLSVEVLPAKITTFNSKMYHLITITDPNELNREWSQEYHINQYGFGDSAAGIYVGGVKATKVVTAPGDYVIAKITLFNNAGFDWNLKYNAMDYTGKPENSDPEALLKEVKHAVQNPTVFNMFTYSIPSELQGYITIEPSTHTSEYSKYTFDFMGINLASVRDGTYGDYFVKVIVASNIPDNLKGKLYEIGVSLNSAYWESYPGHNDPTGSYHDYSFEIPAIKIGIPYTSGDYNGKVFYTAGYSTDLSLYAEFPAIVVLEGARMVSAEDIDLMRTAIGKNEEYNELLEDIWENQLTGLELQVPYLYQLTSNTARNFFNMEIKKKINGDPIFTKFPIPNDDGPDTAKIQFMLKAEASEMVYGLNKVIYNPRLSYTNAGGNSKTTSGGSYLNADAKGPYIKINYNWEQKEVVSTEGYLNFGFGDIYCSYTYVDAEVYIIMKNVGTDTAYNAYLDVELAEHVELIDVGSEAMSKTVYSYFENHVIADLNLHLSPGDSATVYFRGIILIGIVPSGFPRRLAETTTASILKSTVASFALGEGSEELAVSQSFNSGFQLEIDEDTVYKLTFGIDIQDEHTRPLVMLSSLGDPIKTEGLQPVRYVFSRKFSLLYCRDNSEDDVNGLCSSFSENENVVIKEASTVRTYMDYPIPLEFTGYIYSASITYTAELVDELNQVLKKKTISFEYTSLSNEEEASSTPTTNYFATEEEVEKSTGTYTPISSLGEDHPVNYEKDDPEPSPYDEDDEEAPKDTKSHQSALVVSEAGVRPWVVILGAVTGIAVLLLVVLIMIKKFQASPKVLNTEAEPNKPEVVEVEDYRQVPATTTREKN